VDVKKILLSLSSCKYYAIALTSLLVIFTVSYSIPVSGQVEGVYVSEPVTPFVVTPGMLKTMVASSTWQPGDQISEGYTAPTQADYQSLTALEDIVPVTKVQQGQTLMHIDPTFATPVLTFEGIALNGFRPPDTNVDVGPNHIIEMVNVQFQIFDKTGNALTAPANINSLWIAANTNDNCEFNNNGDPIVQYDHLADRWLMSQFVAFSDQCIAISQGPDPVNDGWFLYDFSSPVVNDYFKFGVWPDAYYMGTNAGYPFGHAWAFDRTNMLLGNAATFQLFSIATDGAIMLPSNLDGPAPPANACNVFLRFVEGAEFGGVDRLELSEFCVDFAVPANSAFTALPDIPTAAFDSSLCALGIGAVDCIPQPGTTQELDTVRGFTMYPLQYRNFGTHETLVVNHSVDVNGQDLAGPRWYELQKNGGAWSLAQEQTYSLDDVHRWMGSVAMDKFGNMAMGYSVSDPESVFPGIRYTGRLASDPINTMPQGENLIITGTGSQTISSRWGDYSSMTVDPVDDCSFWYAQEYMPTNGFWQTRIAKLQFSNCAPLVSAIGGDLIPLDTTMVLVAGTQYTAAWMIPAIVSAIGIAIVIARKF